MTVRIGDRLVGLRADTDNTLRRLRTLLAAWIDDSQPDIPWAFDVRLDPEPEARSDESQRRGVRPVPQLRAGQLLMARSRSSDEVLRALANVLGGVLASDDGARTWSGLRPFVDAERVVLVDAQPPALTAGAELTRAGVTELSCWTVALDGRTVHVPPPLGDLDWAALGLDPPPAAGRTATLVGLVALDPDRDHDHTHDDHLDASGAGAAFSRFAVRHPTTDWFSTVEGLARDERLVITTDPAVARRHIVELLHR